MPYIDCVNLDEYGNLILSFDRDNLPTCLGINDTIKDTVDRLYNGDFLQFMKETAHSVPIRITPDDSGWLMITEILNTHQYTVHQALKICRWLNTWYYATTTVNRVLEIMEATTE